MFMSMLIPLAFGSCHNLPLLACCNVAMLRKVELKNFKNHKRTTVDLSSSFNVIVGRNGSGKSAILDAIDWCLFHSRGRELRASSYKSLVNQEKPPNEVMTVTVTLSCDKEFIHLRREMSVKNKPRMSIKRCKHSSSSTDDDFETIDINQLHEIFLELSIPYTATNRILLKQNVNSIASGSPKELLAFIETVVGTDSLKELLDELQKQINAACGQLDLKKEEYWKIRSSKELCKPLVIKLKKMHEDACGLYINWIGSMEIEKSTVQKAIQDIFQKKAVLTNVIDDLKCSIHQDKQIADEAMESFTQVKRRVESANQLKIQTYRQLRSYTASHSNICLSEKAAKSNLESAQRLIRSKAKKVDNLVRALSDSNHKLLTLKKEKCSNEEEYYRCLNELKGYISTHIDNDDVSLGKSSTLDNVILLLVEYVEQEGKVSKAAEIRGRIEERSKGQHSLANISQEQDIVRRYFEECENDLRRARISTCFSKLKLNANIARLLRYDNDKVAPKLSSAMTRLEQRSDSILICRYSFCKSLLKGYLKSMNPEKTFECGLLVDNISLKNERYCTALKVVLGPSLANTMVVQTRQDAMKLSDAAKNDAKFKHLSKLHIHIVGEMTPPPCRKDPTCIHRDIVPLLNVVDVTSSGYRLVLQKKLSRWALFSSSNYDDLVSTATKKKSLLSIFKEEGLNLVTLEGRVFLADGELRSAPMSANPKNGASGDVLEALIFHRISHFTGKNQDLYRVEKEPMLPPFVEVDKAERDALEARCCELRNQHLCDQLNLDCSRQQMINAAEKSRFAETKFNERLQNADKIDAHLEGSLNIHKDIDTLSKLYREEKAILDEKFSDDHSSEVICEAITLQKAAKLSETRLYTSTFEVRSIADDIARKQLQLDRLNCELTSLELKKDAAMERSKRTDVALAMNAERLSMLKEDMRIFNAPLLELSSHNQLRSQMEMFKKKHDNVRRKVRQTQHEITRVEASFDEACQTQIQYETKIGRLDDDIENNRELAADAACNAEVCRSLLDQDCHQSTVFQITSGSHFEHIELPSKEMLDNIRRDVIFNSTKAQNNCESCSAFESEKEYEIDAISYRNSERFYMDSLNDVKLSSILNEKQISEHGMLSDDPLQAFRSLLAECGSIRQQCYQVMNTLKDLRTKFQTLSKDRFHKLLRALDAVNEKLGSYYSSISPSSQCYLDYPRDMACLLEDCFHLGGGVRIRARHGGDRSFREVQHLSGGQVSAVGLTLILSLQACYPSPFVMIDEVDSALDTSTSWRVGELLHSLSCVHETDTKMSRTQYTLISHRPEMQVWARQISGVYSYQGYPTAMNIYFGDLHGATAQVTKIQQN